MSLSSVLDQYQQLGYREFGTLGHPNGSLAVSGRPGWYYVTFPKGATGDVDVGQFPGGIGLERGMTVAIVRDPYTGQRVISSSTAGGATPIGGTAGGGGMTLAAHAATHGKDGSDPVATYLSQTLDFRAVPQTALTVYVYGGVILLAGVLTLVAAQTIDLTAYKPPSGSGACYVLVYFNTAGTIQATAGTTVSSRGLLTMADVPAIPSGCLASAAVILVASNTTVMDTPARRDIVDLRFAGSASHNLLSGTHGDTLTASVVDGDIIIGNVTPKWSRLAISIPAAGTLNYLGINNGELRPSWKSASAAPGVAASVLQSDTAGSLTLGGIVYSKQAAAAGISLDHNSATGNFTLSLSPSNLTANRRATFPNYTGGVELVPIESATEPAAPLFAGMLWLDTS